MNRKPQIVNLAMLCFPNAKINIGLLVTGKRPDGYHDLETVFYPVTIRDALETVTADALRFSSSGMAIPGPPENNLCLNVYRLLKQEFDLPPLHIHLHKNIPVGAGIGGGSADAGFLIRQLNTQFKLRMSDHKMEGIAAEIGADCPFFIRNTPVLANGKGDEFEAVTLDLSAYFLVIVAPGLHSATADAFKGIVPRKPARSLPSLVALPVAEWKAELRNDFEEPIFKKYPGIGEIKQELYRSGALYASMSGSGSAVYALFEKPVGGLFPGKDHRVFYGC